MRAATCARRLRLFDELGSDLLFFFRSFRKNALLSTAVVLTLTLGIGIGTGVFTLINATAFRPRVDKDPDTFLRVLPNQDLAIGRPISESTLNDYLAYRDGTRSLSELAAWHDFRAALGRDDPAEVRSLLVTCNFFSLHGLERPRLGRLFLPEDCSQPGAAPIIVLSEEVWRSRFAADPAVVGKAIPLNRQMLTVVGVAPAGFSGRINRAGVWVPYTMQPHLDLGKNLLRTNDTPWLTLAGRLKPGFSRLDAEAELRILASRQDQFHPGRKTTLKVTDGSWFQEPGMRELSIWVIPLIMGALTLVLLISCVNVTTLLLSRAAARQHEIAVRLALGAGRTRLLRMLMTESLMLAAVAGVFSLFMAYRLPPLLLLHLNAEPWNYPLEPDWRVFAYAGCMTLLAGCVSGLAPALQSLKLEVSTSLKGIGSLFGSGVRSESRIRNILVAAQIAMSLVVLAGAGLFVRAHYRMLTADPGFETKQALLVPLGARGQAVGHASSGALRRAIAQRVEALPGVQSVSYTGVMPFSGQRTMFVRFPGQRKEQSRRVFTNSVSPGFFETLRIPILRGRSFVEADTAGGTGVSPAVVSDAFARTFWPTESPLGSRLETADGNVLEVAGVARDVVSMHYGETDGPTIYLPWKRDEGRYSLLVRFSGDSQAIARSVGSVIREISPDTMAAVRTIQSSMDETISHFWNLAVLIIVVGGLATVLAVIGIYGVAAFAASRRTKEFGIRIALGAQRQDIAWEMLASGAKPIASGLLVGLTMAFAGSLALAKTFARGPFHLDTRDPAAYAAVSVLLVSAALAAMLRPARRAAAADPLQALRHE